MNVIDKFKKQMLLSKKLFSGHESEQTRFLNRMQTLEYVISNRCGVSRFGDGEIDLALFGKFKSHEGILFQEANPELSEKLEEILFNPIDGLCVCVNYDFSLHEKWRVLLDYERSKKEYVCRESCKRENDIGVLQRVKETKLYSRYLKFIRKRTRLSFYGEATSFILSYFYKEYLEDKITEVLTHFAHILQKKKILFVCPFNPLMGKSFKDLFDEKIICSPKSVEFVFIPNKNAFDHYGEIKKKILNFPGLDGVFLQAGPTATVLSADLIKNHGLLAYDVGSWNVSLGYAFTKHGMTF